MNQRRVILLKAAAVAGGLLCLGLLFAMHTKKQAPQSDAVLLSTPQMREAWLNLRGWQVGAPEVTQTQVPQEWRTDAGQQWLALQAAQGLHPERCAGEPAARYVYPVLNAPNAYYYAELLLCGDTLIGAQIYDASTQAMQSVR